QDGRRLDDRAENRRPAAGAQAADGLDPRRHRPEGGLESTPGSVVVRAAGLSRRTVGRHRSIERARRSTSKTTSWSRSRRTSPWSERSASSRFTDWRDPPIIPASSDWVY